MKKLFLGLAIISTSLAFAQQTTEKEPVRFGIKAGGNASSFSEQELSINNLKAGYYAGVLVNIPLSREFSIQPEVLYNELGSRNVVSSTEITNGPATINAKNEYRATLRYITVPVMVQFKPMRNFYVEAGPEFSYFVSGKNTGETKVTTTIGSTTSTQTQSTSDKIDKDNINKLNFGLGLGVGYDFTPNFGINARYVNSLSNIYNSTLQTTTNSSPNNRTFQLGLSYKF
ncbi:porin family protein [Chryseobacterium sp.]|uniref:porin family protein n=1 Tax=Chryseobacterium sp. TaxID=1871047 RepID=UPI0025B86C4A|nr:porin family protein [Chryseobacterium sp.]